MKDIVALHVQTESGDEYLKVYTDVLDTIDLIQRMKYEFDEEFAYIAKIKINDNLCCDIDKQLIWESIEELN